MGHDGPGVVELGALMTEVRRGRCRTARLQNLEVVQGSGACSTGSWLLPLRCLPEVALRCEDQCESA